MSRRRRKNIRSTPSKEQLQEVPIVLAAQQLVRALETFTQRISKCQDELLLVSLPRGLKWIYGYAESMEHAHELYELETAWEIVVSGTPVASGTPRYEDDTSGFRRRWMPPLTPGEILYHAEVALPGDEDYLTQLMANAKYQVGKEKRKSEYLAQKCRLPSCGTIPVYMPPNGFFSGYACWRHADESEATVIRETWEAVVRDHDCPGCTATAGSSCHIDDAAKLKRLPSGEWDHVRSFRGLKVHELRLDLGTVVKDADAGLPNASNR